MGAGPYGPPPEDQPMQNDMPSISQYAKGPVTWYSPEDIYVVLGDDYRRLEERAESSQNQQQSLYRFPVCSPPFLVLGKPITLPSGGTAFGGTLPDGTAYALTMPDE